MYLDTKVMAILFVCHFIALFVCSWFMIKEYRGKKRGEVLSAYTYVVFISVLNMVAYFPAINVSLTIPVPVLSTVCSARDLAVLFFVFGVMQLKNKAITGN